MSDRTPETDKLVYAVKHLKPLSDMDRDHPLDDVEINETSGIHHPTGDAFLIRHARKLEKQRDHAYETIDTKVGELQVLKEAFFELMDAMNVSGRPWKLEGYGFATRRAEEICELYKSLLL